MARFKPSSSETQAHKAEAVAALNEGKTLVLSNRTDVNSRVIHSDLARRLVLLGDAEYLPDPERPGWKLTTHIRKRTIN